MNMTGKKHKIYEKGSNSDSGSESEEGSPNVKKNKIEFKNTVPNHQSQEERHFSPGTSEGYTEDFAKFVKQQCGSESPVVQLLQSENLLLDPKPIGTES